MSFLFWYFLGAVIMMAIALCKCITDRKIKLSDLIVLPIVGALSFGGVIVIVVVLICHGIERLLDNTGTNKVIWEK